MLFVAAEHFTDLIKQIFLWWFDFRLESIYTSVPAATKTTLDLKVVKID